MEKNKDEKSLPSWIGALLLRKFFKPCQKHEELQKNELRMYCIKCNASLCAHCLLSPPSSCSHRYLQIRKYVYNDVVRVLDMKKLFDCARIQAFVVNGQKVIFLNPKEQAEKTMRRRGANPCLTCHRALPEPNRYCSIACKIEENYEPENQASPEVTSSAAISSADPPESSENSAAAGKRGAQRRKGVPRRSPLF